ncbi:MAG: hypothetical protein AB7R89_25780 [Dehalococcoidia bacterium]
MVVSEPYAVAVDYRAAVTKSDAAEDAEILADLTAVSRFLDRRLGRFFTKDAADVARVFPTPHPRNAPRPGWAEAENPWLAAGVARTLFIDDIVSATSIIVDEDRDGAFDDASLGVLDYELLPRNAALGPEPKPYTAIELTDYGSVYAWTPNTRVQITGVWGWPSVPPAIKAATIQLTAILRLESPRATQRVNELDQVIGTSRQAQLIVNDLVRHYRKVTV